MPKFFFYQFFLFPKYPFFGHNKKNWVKKFLGRKILGQKKIWGQNKCWVRKNFGYQKIVGQKKFWVLKNVWSQIVWVPKILSKKYLVSKMLVRDKFWFSKKFLVLNNFGFWKILGPKKFGSWKFWIPKNSSNIQTKLDSKLNPSVANRT